MVWDMRGYWVFEIVQMLWKSQQKVDRNTKCSQEIVQQVLKSRQKADWNINMLKETVSNPFPFLPFFPVRTSPTYAHMLDKICISLLT